jgi:hypothetical protein
MDLGGITTTNNPLDIGPKCIHHEYRIVVLSLKDRPSNAGAARRRFSPPVDAAPLHEPRGQETCRPSEVRVQWEKTDWRSCTEDDSMIPGGRNAGA